VSNEGGERGCLAPRRSRSGVEKCMFVLGSPGDEGRAGISHRKGNKSSRRWIFDELRVPKKAAEGQVTFCTRARGLRVRRSG